MRARLAAVFVFAVACVLAAKTRTWQPSRVAVEHQAVPPISQPNTPQVAPSVATRLPIELIGTIVRVEGSIATIKVAQGERENIDATSKIGQLATVVRIERERVYFTNLANGTNEYIRIRPYDPSRAVSLAAMSEPGDQKEFQVSREKVDQQLQNLPQLLMSARAVPVTDAAGKIHGFRIDSMDDSSFFKSLGLQPGDVLTEVNGTKLESVEGVMKLFNELRDSSMIQLKVSRQSRDLQLGYLIR